MSFIVVRIYVVMQTIDLILAKIKIIGPANNFITAFTTSAFVKATFESKVMHLKVK